MRRMDRSRPRAALVALAAVTAACAVNPATGERQLSFIGEGREIEMGRDYDRQVVAQLGLYDDPAWQSYIQSLGSRLAATSERPHLPWTFRVVDDPVVNAFALPGGFIYVTRGILAHFQSEAQLAAVLGHEIGHVTGRHSVNQMSRQQLAQIGLVVGVVLKPELMDYAGLASAGLGVLFLKHGRDDEREADDLGLRYMRRGNFAAREMAPVFSMLELVSTASGGGRTPEWLSTHPNPENRRERIEAAVATLPAESLGTVVNRDGYLRRLDGLIFGNNPREGYFEGSAFFHPALAFRLTFPEGWQTVNQRTVVAAISPNQDAIVQVTLADQATPGEAAQAFFASNEVRGSAAPTSINGFAGYAGRFTATSENATLAGEVVFLAHSGAVFRLLGYSTQAGWPRFENAASRTLRSFDRVTDPSVLNVQPRRLSVVTLDRGMTVAEFVRRYPTPVSVEATALVNQLTVDGQFAAGTLAKRIVGQ